MTTHDLFDDAFDHPTPEPPAKPVASRRDRRHRRTVRRRVVVGVLTAFLVLAALLVVTDSVRLGSGDRPLLAAENSSRSPDPKVPTSSDLSTRTLSATTPLRLWIAVRRPPQA